jgi:hypothetical protein
LLDGIEMRLRSSAKLAYNCPGTGARRRSLWSAPPRLEQAPAAGALSDTHYPIDRHQLV